MNQATQNAKYIAVITGAIGAGKTTVFKSISRILEERFNDSFLPIPEYIDSPENGDLYRRNLSAYLSGELNDKSFQNIIQWYYEQALDPVLFNDKVVILERSMSDSIAIFCNLAYHRGRLDITSFALLHGVCLLRDRAVNCPNYFLGNFDFVRIDSTLSEEQVTKQVLSVIESDLAAGVRTRVFGLDCHFAICKERIDKRSRVDESSTYDHSYTALNSSMYSRLYDIIERSPHFVNFTELSSLFDSKLLRTYLINQAISFVNSSKFNDSQACYMKLVETISPNSTESFKHRIEKISKAFDFHAFASTILSSSSTTSTIGKISSSFIEQQLEQLLSVLQAN